MKTTSFLIYLLLSFWLMQWLLPTEKLCFIEITQQNILLNTAKNADYLEKIEITSLEYQKIKKYESKEYFYRENLYDIHSLQQIKEKYYLFALVDKAETQLQNIHFQHLKKANSTQKGKNYTFLFTWLYAEKEITWHFLASFMPKLYKKKYEESAFSPYLAIEIKPPTRLLFT